MKNGMKSLIGIVIVLTLGACNNFFHDLVPPDGNKIVSFVVDGQMKDAVIGEDSVLVTVGKEVDITAIVPVIKISPKASVIPVTFDYVSAAFPSVDIFKETRNLYTTDNFSDYVIDLIKGNPDFNVPVLDIPIDFSGPVDFFVVSAQGSFRQYTVSVNIDSGEPLLIGLNFAKYDNPELIKDVIGTIYEGSFTVNAVALYPMEIPFLSYALIPSFEVIGDRIEVDGNKIISGQSAIQFAQMLGTQVKTITVWREGKTTDYALLITFEEDPDTIRSITDFRFNKMDNAEIAANAVASIINTESTGVINIQVFYSGIQPSVMLPRFISPGNVSSNGVPQTSGFGSHDFSSPVEYRVVSRDGQYTRIYTVKTEFISVTDAAPRILSFRFAGNVNSELVRDTVGEISDGLIMIDAHYGSSFAPETLIPEFTAQGIVTVLSSVQISGLSAQNFSRQVKYTVTNPLNSFLTRDYWVQTRMLRDTSADAKIDTFGFYPEDNPGLPDTVTGKIDQIAGKIVMYAPSGSGVTTRLMIPRFTGAGIVNVGGVVQSSGVSGMVFAAPITYTVVSANGANTRSYKVEVRELTSRIHVNGSAFGNSDGTTWENAFRSLKAACEAALEFPDDVPVEIWIAAGTYTTNNTTDYFQLTPNTSYIGGFAGHETAKSQRNTAANKTLISGYTQHLFSSAASLNGDLSFETLYLSGGAGIYAMLNGTEITVTDCSFSNVQTAVYVNGGSAKISDAAFFGCNNAITLDCSGETEITRVNVSDYSDNAVQLTGSGNKTLGTVTVSQGQNGISINTAGNVSAEGITLQTLSGTGMSMSGTAGIKYLSGIIAKNVSGSALNIANTGSGSFTLTGSSSFDNSGTITVSSASSITILNTGITGSKGASALDITANGNTTIDAVTIDGVPNGRGINMVNNGSAAISNTVIKNCVTAGNGGGISISGTGSANISYTTITGCKANTYGGGMYLSCSGSVVVSPITIDSVSLTASTGYGGGIYRSGGSLRIENSNIRNISGGNSDGVYHSVSADLVISTLQLQNIPRYGIYCSNNGVRNLSGITAVTGIGGSYGVYAASLSSGSFTLADSRFTGCGVYCSASAVSINVSAVTISNPPAYGLYAYSPNGTITINNNTNINNVSGANYGLYANTGSGTGTVTINSVNIDRVNFSGMAITGGNATVSNSTIRNCTSANSGGGIVVSTSGTTRVSDTIIENVQATSAYGGGIYFSGTGGGNLTISGCTIRNAKAGTSGGGIYCYNGILTINSNTRMELCQASEFGAIYYYPPSGSPAGSISNSYFINCTANKNYKIFWSQYFTLISGCEFTHDSNLPVLPFIAGNPFDDQIAVSFFGHTGNFESCTFTNLRGNMAMLNFIFSSFSRYMSEIAFGYYGGGSLTGGGNLTLRNCTFNFSSFQPGSAGLLALYSGQASPYIAANNLLMDGCKILDSSGPRPIMLLANEWTVFSSNPGAAVFRLRLNNTYNGMQLLTAIAGLSNVFWMMNDALPGLAP
jgi:hypothetical protein